MTTSEQINELATALAKAQGEIGGAVKDAQNPHFRSKYADLASVREAAKPLAKHGLAVIQSCRMAVRDDGMVAEVETRLLHSSGQWMADTLAVPVSKPDAQGIGSAITYGRRYTLAAFAGIAPEDDDGEAAVGRSADRAPAGAMNVAKVAVSVDSVRKRNTRDGSEKYVIVAGGREFVTTQRSHAEAAKAANEAGLQVDMTFVDGRFGPEVMELAERQVEAVL